MRISDWSSDVCSSDLEDEEATDEERALAEAEVERIESAIEAISEKPPVIDPEQRSQLGTFLVLGRDGQPRLHDGFYREKPERIGGDGERDTNDEATALAPVTKRGGFSQRLTDELAIHRREHLAVHVAAAPVFPPHSPPFLRVS